MKSNAKLLHGKRNLYVGWSGSHLSYEVRLYQVINSQDMEVEVKEWNATLHENDLQIKEVEFETRQFNIDDQYKIKVISSGVGEEEPKEGRFTVVSDKEDPLSKNPEIRKQLFHLQASWLAKQGNYGEWQFEAYQKLGNNKNYLAEAVRFGLSLGVQ